MFEKKRRVNSLKQSDDATQSIEKQKIFAKKILSYAEIALGKAA